MYGMLIRYNRYTIYQIYIVKSQNNIIQVKNLQLFKENKAKVFIDLLNNEDVSIF